MLQRITATKKRTNQRKCFSAGLALTLSLNCGEVASQVAKTIQKVLATHRHHLHLTNKARGTCLELLIPQERAKEREK